jgi:hypothetical protein
VAGDPEDHAARDEQQHPGVAVRPQCRPREQDGHRDADEREPDQRPGPVATVPQRGSRDGVLLALVRHDEGSCCVDDDAGAAEQGEDDEADAVEGGMDVEVTGEAAADAGDHAVGAAALEALRRSVLECVCLFGHGSMVASAYAHDHPE